jgi:hypothetical protein
MPQPGNASPPGNPVVQAAHYPSFSAALAAALALAAPGTDPILSVTDIQRIFEDTRIPPLVTLSVLEGGSIDGPHTLTLLGSFKAGPYRVFGPEIDVVLEAGSVPWAYPQWWGGASLAPAVLGRGTFQMNLILSESGMILVRATIPPALPAS